MDRQTDGWMDRRTDGRKEGITVVYPKQAFNSQMGVWVSYVLFREMSFLALYVPLLPN